MTRTLIPTVNPVMNPDDRVLLAEVRRVTENPFRDPVRVGGVLVPRKLARHIERVLSRLDLMDRRAATGSAVPGYPFHAAQIAREGAAAMPDDSPSRAGTNTAPILNA